jgi:peptidoglycan/xylan/chitin deacetylase (PgdA/CDA1 family)
MKKGPFLKIARYTGIHKAFRRFYSGIGTILMFHRIAKKGTATRIEKNTRNEVSPEYLESLVNYLMTTGHEIVSLDELYRILMGRKKQKKCVAFTFDDGYADVYSLAYPIFKKYGLPFTVYVSTNYPDGKAVLWWYLLEDLVLKNDSVSFTHDKRTYFFDSSTAERKEAAFHSIRTMLIRQSTGALEPLLKDIFEPYGIDAREHCRKLALDWNQLTIMSEDPLVTIGAHTVNHYALSKLDIEQAEYEIRRSREIIESRIGEKVEHFSYPFGSRAEAGKREFDLVKNAGFKTVTTTRIGNIFPEHKSHLECLPRVPVRGDREDLFHLELFLSGYIPALSHNFRKVVTV